jgi:predicted metal-binding membrane protein
MIAVARHEVRPDTRWAIAFAWLLALAAELTGRSRLLHHDQLIQGGLSRPAALVVFLLAWQSMIAAMMLPSSLPMIRLFSRTAMSQPRARLARAIFISAYALVWTGFGAVAFAIDIAIHAAVNQTPWLYAHSYLIGGGTLLLAAAFQFSPLKDACLRQCRNPGAFILRYYRRGLDAALVTGLRHGAFCLGCCWALMLVAFAAGAANLAWMAVLTLLMTLEKRSKIGPALVQASGVAMFLGGALIVLRPVWPPT